MVLAGSSSVRRAAVAIAPFRSLAAVVPSYVHHYLPVIGHLIPDSFIAGGIAQAGLLGDFDPAAASPEVAISRTRAQVLLIHGEADDHIPAEHSKRLHAAAPDHSELVLVPEDDHFSIIGDRTGVIGKQGMAWLHRWLDSDTP